MTGPAGVATGPDGSEEELPGGRQPNVVVAVVVPVVVDIQTIGIEVADVDAVATQPVSVPAPVRVTGLRGAA
jgi:hypothetical protein